MLSSAEENNAALVSPLLRFGEEGDDGDRESSSGELEDFPAAFGERFGMETPPTNSSADPFENRMLSSCPPGVRRVMYRFAQVPTLNDSMPSLLQIITTSGKLSALVFLAVYLTFTLLWLPFWLLSFFVTEFGVYALAVSTIFYIGRIIIRMIAFPGASNKVVSEVETEFAKYSVRMLVSAANCLRELAQAMVSTGGGGGGSAPTSGGSLSPYEIVPLWKRAKSYRDRALGVYLEVLNYIYEQNGQTSGQPGTQRTRYGTNRISGDIGNLNGLTVRTIAIQSTVSKCRMWA